jgi:hypothetical protein
MGRVLYTFSQIAFQPEDEIDQLFSYLTPVEPPTEVIARILSQVRSLSKRPVSSWTPLFTTHEPPQDSEDSLIVRREQSDPS